MEEEIGQVKLIDWDSSRLYIPLLSEEDCDTEPTVRAAAEYNTVTRVEHLLPLQQQLVFLLNGPFKGHKYDTMYDWCHLYCDKRHKK